MKPVIFKDIIVFENDDYLLVNKPPHLATLEDRSADINLQMLAREYCPSSQIGHRLDKETSGVLAIAKNPEAYRSLAMQFEHREVKKKYHAVACGIHDFQNISVNAPIQIMSRGYVKISRQDGKPATTIFNTIEVFKAHTLVECMPTTGRMHQIRIHLNFKGAPIVADREYEGSDVFLSDLKKNFNLKKWTEEEPLIKRVALHSYKLQFKGLDGTPIEGVAPYPKDIDALLKQLRKYK